MSTIDRQPAPHTPGSAAQAETAAAQLFAGEGELHARCRALDWGATSLGPVERWPESLRCAVRLTLDSGFPMCVYGGPELVLIYNDGFVRALGTGKHPWALGWPAREVWPEIWERIAPEFAQVLAGGPPLHYLEQEFVIERDGQFERTCWSYAFSPVRAEGGTVLGIHNVATETTERARAEAALRASQDAHRTLLETMDQGFCAIEKVPTAPGAPSDFRYLSANPAFERHTGMRDVVGRTILELVPDAEPEIMGIYDDVVRTQRQRRVETYVAPLDLWMEADVVPMPAPGQLAVLFNNVTARKRADLALRASEQRQAFLLELSDALRPLADPAAVQRAALRVVGEHLGVDRVLYAEVTPDGGHFVMTENYVRDGGPALTGHLPTASFGPVSETLRAGKTVVIPDVATEPGFSDAERAAFAAIDVGAAIAIPLVKRERWVSNLAVHQRTPRAWTADEVRLLEEAAERTWEAVEGARAEAALRESEERLRLFGEASSDVLWMRDARTLQWEYISAAFETIYGRDRVSATRGDDLHGWAEMIVPEDRAHALGHIERVREGERVVFEYRIQRPDGGIRWLRNTDFPVLDARGRVQRIAGIGQDVTEHKRAEQALHELNETLEQRVAERTREVREQEERFRTLVETSALTVWAASPEGQIVEDSPTWRAFTGQTIDEWLGDGWTNVIHPDDREAVYQSWRRAVEARAPWQHELRLWHAASGRWRWTDGRAVPLRDAHADVRGWIGINIDIEERMRAQAARAEALRQLVRAEEAERRRLSRELHDHLGQQITGLLLGLRALELETAATTRLRDLQQLADGIARDIQRTAVALRPPALDNLGLERALRSHLEEWSARSGIEVDFHSAGLDGSRLPQEIEITLYRSVQEGLTNVLKHARATRVNLVLERRGGMVRAILEDDGIGFAVEAALASPEKARRLGLRGMRERLALVGGELEIESAPGQGTTLFARVPAPDGAEPGAAAAEGERA